MTDKKESKEIVEEQNKAVVASGINFEEDAGKGIETADKDSFAIPFVLLLQAMSPLVETVDGAKAGKFIDSVTEELMDVVEVIPCQFKRQYIRWAPRELGGGYKGAFDALDVENGKVEGAVFDSETNSWKLGEDELKDTRTHFVLYKNKEGNWIPAIIALGSTQIKKSKRWISRIQSIELKNSAGKAFNPPSYSHIYTISSVKEENSKGAWWGYKIDLNRQVDDNEVYQKAREFYEAVSKGEVEISQPPSAEAEADQSGF